MKKIGETIAHLLFAMSFVFLALSIANHFNKSMAFIDHHLTKEVLACFLAVTYIFTIVTLMAALWEGKVFESVIRALNLTVVIALVVAIIRDALKPQQILFSKGPVITLLFVLAIIGIINYGVMIYGKRD